MGTILVIDAASGQIMKVSPGYNDKLFRVMIETHCANTAYYCNSFDRISITEYQARALFLVTKPDAYRVFARYKEQRGYADAIDRGLTYKTEFQKIESLQADTEPYRVRFTSLLQIYDGDQPVRSFIIESEGEIRRQTPQYPENTTGLFFTKYVQTYKPQEVNK